MLLYQLTQTKLICVNRLSGKIRWINQLPDFARPKKKQGQIDYRGPILVGNRLIVVGSNGVVVNIDPVTGSYQSQTRVKAGDRVLVDIFNDEKFVDVVGTSKGCRAS